MAYSWTKQNDLKSKQYFRSRCDGDRIRHGSRLARNEIPSLYFVKPKIIEPSPLSTNCQETNPINEPQNIESVMIKNELICRACLCDDVESLKSFLDDTPLLDMYNGCTFLQVEIGDGLPMNLCTACISKCTDWLSFKQQCEKNDLQLRSQLITIPIAFPQISETPSNIDIDERKMMAIDVPLGVQIPKTTQNDNNLDLEITPLKKGLIYEEIDVETEFIDNEDSKNNEKESKKPYECDECFKTCATFFSLARHKKVHANPNVGCYKCEICDKDFVCKSSLTYHILHQHATQFPCTICPKEFYLQSRLIIHMRKHTGERPFECKICKKCFISKYHLYDHMRCHSDKHKFLCSVCGREFKKSFNLNEHLITHTGERRFTCTICNKSFTASGTLKKHLLLHSNPKSNVKPTRIQKEDQSTFTCNICEQLFLTRKELSLHLRTHADERLFPCTDCDKVFKRNCDLIIHLRRHTGERPFSCNLCTQSFGSQKMLKNHNKRNHLLT